MNTFQIFSIFSACLLKITSSSPVDQVNNGPFRSLADQIGKTPYFQGDIRYDENREIPKIGTNGMIKDYFRWPNKTLTYSVDPAYTAEEKAKITEGVKLLTSSTCITIKERTNEEHYLFIKKGPKGGPCNSFVGYWHEPAQEVNLAGGLEWNDYCLWPSTVAHELMHALGVHHEFARPDRDDWIDIRWENIQPGAENNYDIPTENGGVSTFDVTYDYGSVMHYQKTAASKNGEDVMIPKQPWDGDFGNNVGPTSSDIQGLKIMYNC